MAQMIEIIFFALVAVYLAFRLWTLLGQNTPDDEERQENKQRSAREEKGVANIITLPQREDIVIEAKTTADALPYGVREGLRQLQQQEPDFDIDDFMDGAKYAFKLIVGAFSQGDRQSLRDLLTPEVLDGFLAAIAARETAEQQVETVINSFDRVDIDGIELLDTTAHIVVRFKTHQTVVTVDKSGAIIDNPARISVPMTDIWTFERTINAPSPNWLLCATRSETYRQ